jgi:molybdopterin-guanine dinucleotide biosynthesis protein B
VQLVHISGVGRNVGKTLLGEKLTKTLSSNNVDVCVVKHVHHGVDFRVKDTGRYLSAGARTVVALGPQETMIVHAKGIKVDEAICRLLRYGCKVVLVEGFREDSQRMLALGGCVVYFKGEGIVNLEARCGKYLNLNIDGAVNVLLDMLSRDCCEIEADQLCGTTSITPCL